MPKPDKYYWTVGRILEQIYKSEIHFSIGWMWDGGFDYKIGADLSYIEGKVESTGTDDMEAAMLTIAAEIATEYPDSKFAEWWKNFSS